ncbi:MAG: class GN sortase [Gammaproteobacteria bacterium]|nr:class GN sortase [Gammaproteobacteria bacterium]
MVSLAIGIWYLGSAGWIYAKAYAATFLIDDAWVATLSNNKIHKPWPWADTWPVGQIAIPSLGLNEIVLSGDSGATLAFGPGLSNSGADLDSDGVKLISGHRDTHFSALQNLKVHDEIHIKTAAGDSHYKVTNLRVVDSRTFTVDADTASYDLLLATCYPFNSSDVGGHQRYIVEAIKV